MIEGTIQRFIYSEKSTIGELTFPGHDFKCHTLEDKVRPDGVKVPHETAIPEGRYRLTIDYSNRFKRYMFHLLDVPNFEGIRIHCGNTDADTDGCVLVGISEQNDWIGESHVAFVGLWNLLTIPTGYDSEHLCAKYGMREETWITVKGTAIGAAA
jgi:hypothetical protein